MVDLSTIKGLQTTFQEIGKGDVGVQQTPNEGAAFGRKVNNKGQAWPGQGITATNSAILGTVLGQLKDAGASSRLLQFAEQTFHEMNYQKPITGRKAAQAMDKIAQFAECLAKNTEEAIANFDAKGEKAFNEHFSDVLTQVSQGQGHGVMPMNEQTEQRLLGDFKNACKQHIQDTDLPPTQGQYKTILTNIAQQHINTVTHKTLCDACAMLRTPLDGKMSHSELEFHNAVVRREMNVDLDAKARDTLNAMWKAESQQAFMGGKPHKPNDKEIATLLDDVIEKYLDQVAAENAAKTDNSVTDQNPFSALSDVQSSEVSDKNDNTEIGNTVFLASHHAVPEKPAKNEEGDDKPDVKGPKPTKQPTVNENNLHTETKVKSDTTKSEPEIAAGAAENSGMQIKITVEGKPDEVKPDAKVEDEVASESSNEANAETSGAAENKTDSTLADAKVEDEVASESSNETNAVPSSVAENKADSVVSDNTPSTAETDNKSESKTEGASTVIYRDPTLKRLHNTVDEFREIHDTGAEIETELMLHKTEKGIPFDPNNVFDTTPERAKELDDEVNLLDAGTKKL